MNAARLARHISPLQESALAKKWFQEQSQFLYFCTEPPSNPKITVKLKSPTVDRKYVKITLNATNKVIYGPKLGKKSKTSSGSGTRNKSLKVADKKALVTNKMYNAFMSLNSSNDNIIIANEDGTNNSDNINNFTEEECASTTAINHINKYAEVKEKMGSDTANTNTDAVLSLNKLPYDLPSTSINIEEVRRFPFTNAERENNEFIGNSNGIISSISIFEGGYTKLPSVRKIIQATMPDKQKIILERWEKNMIESLGEEGFKMYRQGLLDKGKIFHECIELELRGETPSEEQLVGIEQHWKSIEHVLPSITNVKALESRVIHPSLHYQGCIDCIGMYKNMPVVCEFKTATSPKVTLRSTYDDPLQIVAYIGALNYDLNYSLPNINGAILVVAYPTGLPAHVHVLSKVLCNKYWSQWCYRLAQFWKMQVGDLNNEDASVLKS